MRRISESEFQARKKMIIDAMQCGGYKKAADKLGVSLQTLHATISNMGIREEVSAIYKKQTAEKEDFIINMISRGMSNDEVSLALNIPMNHVRYIRYKRGVHTCNHANKGKIHYKGRYDLRSKMMSDLYEMYTLDNIAEVFGYSQDYIRKLVIAYRNSLDNNQE